MANLTIAIDKETLRKARIRALEDGTSVNALLRQYLENYAGRRQEREKAVQEILELSTRSKSRRGSKRWTRDQLHERKG